MTHHDQIAKLRREYSKQVMDESSVAKDPFTQFTSWFNEAVEVCSGEPNAMALATSTADGVPSVRMLLLKGFDKSGFSFYSNYQSRKGHELDENPRAEMLFYWNDLERQVRISGKIEKLPRAESVAYFVTRPRGAQIGATASLQSSTLESRAALESKLAQLEGALKDKEVPCPDSWGGYRLIPSRFEFWQGRESRLHDRVLYGKDLNSGWEISRLYP